MSAQDLRRIWNPSPPPSEDWGDGEWEYWGIVNQEMDAYRMTCYEVKWPGWQRKDAAGTNTTWQRTNPDMTQVERKWDNDRTDKRAEKAKESLAIKIGIEPDQPWHEDATVEWEDAYIEKLAERDRRGLRDYMHWQSIKHVTDSDSDSDGVSVRSEGGSVPNPPSANRPVRPELRPQSQPDPEVNQVRRRDRRKELQAEWNRAIKSARAAPLYIVTGSNAQDVPPGLEGFEYCEQHYVRAEGVPGPPDPSFLAICDCTTGCRSAQRCDCQLASELVNEAGERKYAYNSEEIFKFNLCPGVVVIECNEGCTCPQTCQNRVAQRPRDVPMEVFYTGDCGWGVRATTDLPVGKVLGVYTGKLIRREDADNLSDEHRSYIFDLDMLESGDEDASTVRYSVDSYQYGNWSRFINHSCEPNMKVYPVVWDTVAELNQPYLAFVTTKAVRARTELTIDYNPRDAVAHKQGKSKGKSRVPEGATRCKCGAEGCRGWVMV